TIHPEYLTLAARIVISNHHKNTPKTFSDAVDELYNIKPRPMVSNELYKITMNNATRINKVIVNERDFTIDYSGFRTFCRSYLLKDSTGRIIERPQYLYMRVALGIHGDNLEAAFETYHALSENYIMHATPTLFNAGTPRP